MNARELGIQAAGLVDDFAIGARSGVLGAKDGVKLFVEAFRTELAARQAARERLSKPITVTNSELTGC
jgi:hypothetical protein